MTKDQIQALKKPLLTDEDRIARFFDLLPEMTFSDFLNELNASCRFNDTAQEMLEAYLIYLSKPTIHFDNDRHEDVFSLFNNEFQKFNTFLESNFFVENDLYVLHPAMRSGDPTYYEEKKSELKERCQSLANQYLNVVQVFSSVRPPKKSPTSSVSYANGKFRYGDKYYTPTSKRQIKMLDVLWEFRSKKMKGAEGYQIEALAVQLDMADSPSEVTSSMRDSLRQMIKDLNKYLRSTSKRFPIEIRVKDNLIYLIVN